VDLSIAVAVGLHNMLGLRTVTEYASETVKSSLGMDCAKGVRWCAFALTESGAGSDPRRINTEARRQADGSWILNGTKCWTGIGAWCGAVVTFAKAFDETGSPLGITGFAFNAETPGFRVGSESMTMGLRGMFQGEIHFEDLHLGKDQLQGKPGDGLIQAGNILMTSRIGCVAFSCGAMHRCLQITQSYVSQRKISTGRMMDNGCVSDGFAKMLAKTAALDSFFEWLCERVDRGEQLSDELCCVAKVIGPEWAFEVADGCMQLMGGRGYEESNVVARIFRDIRVIRIFEGPTETLRFHLGGLVVRSDKAFREVCESLEAVDVYELTFRKLEELSSIDYLDSPQTKHRVFSWMGEIVATGLVYAVVRKHGGESLAARISEDVFRMAIEAPCPRAAWASVDEIDQLLNPERIQYGEIAPHQPGEKWESQFNLERHG
jgi:alkylation response protein AidB-like acyl-CoA dehydrogenase